MEQSLRDSVKTTEKMIPVVEGLGDILGSNYHEILYNQRNLFHKGTKCIAICESNRPIVSPRYFAACCAMLNDDLLDESSKTQIMTLALLLYSSLSRKSPKVAFKELKVELASIGINLPTNVEDAINSGISKQPDRIPSIFEIL